MSFLKGLNMARMAFWVGSKRGKCVRTHNRFWTFFYWFSPHTYDTTKREVKKFFTFESEFYFNQKWEKSLVGHFPHDFFSMNATSNSFSLTTVRGGREGWECTIGEKLPKRWLKYLWANGASNTKKGWKSIFKKLNFCVRTLMGEKSMRIFSARRWFKGEACKCLGPTEQSLIRATLNSSWKPEDCLTTEPFLSLQWNFCNLLICCLLQPHSKFDMYTTGRK